MADPQITDAHSYPGRPWPLSSLTILITDNYVLRGYKALERRLHPDSLFFVGDLFDGGREWKTERGDFVDPHWGRQRPADEAKWVDTWHRKYGQRYWLSEYERFGEIFFRHWNDGGEAPGAWQRGRKLVASLPGNHDIGFGAQVQVPVRNRFEAFFGDVNRVDVVGNHTVVSVDSLSLSAGTSDFRNTRDLSPIYGPVNVFLDQVKTAKRKAAREELRAWHGMDDAVPRFEHSAAELGSARPQGVDGRHTVEGGEGPDFPTILLTHVPLYREPGTLCGPRREHWPPSKPPKSKKGPVTDLRNAISVTGGYQYQNVLSDIDSQKLVHSVGNVVHVFSGDDHDYCEVVHPESRGGVREITIKSISMAMGVSVPGFLMVSLWNPVDDRGRTIPGSSLTEATLQTHLCLLPNQIHTYMKYVAFVVLSLVLLGVRALLVPVLNLTPFAIDPAELAAYSSLPVHAAKHKVEPPIHRHGLPPTTPPQLKSASSSGWPRARSSSLLAETGGIRWQASKSRQKGMGATAVGHQHGWARSPRINLDEPFYDPRGPRVGGTMAFGLVGREMWTTTWRVAWVAVLFWVSLSRER